MSVEILKALLALGTGAFSALIAFLANWVPPADHTSVNFFVMTAVVALIKRGLDWLAAKSATPADPTSSPRKTAA